MVDNPEQKKTNKHYDILCDILFAFCVSLFLMMLQEMKNIFDNENLQIMELVIMFLGILLSARVYNILSAKLDAYTGYQRSKPIRSENIKGMIYFAIVFISSLLVFLFIYSSIRYLLVR